MGMEVNPLNKLDIEPPPAAFHQAPRAALRQAAWWSRLGYIQKRLPEAIHTALRQLGLSDRSRVLDFGCADQPYRHLLPANAEYLGADLQGNSAAQVTIGEDGRLPLTDVQFDVVLSTQVLEHVSDPKIYLEECARLLRPGGKLLLSTHGIMVYHPDPVDFWRWTAAGLRFQVEQAGFTVLECRGVMGLAATGLQLFQDALYWRLPRWLRSAWSGLMQILIAFFDRLDSDQNRAMNALVFIVIAEKRDLSGTVLPMAS